MHPQDEDTVQPDAHNGDEAQAEGQAPDQTQAVGVRILLPNGLDVANAEQDEQDGDVGEVAHALSPARPSDSTAECRTRDDLVSTSIVTPTAQRDVQALHDTIS